MRGRSLRLSPLRRLAGDLLHASAAVPTVPVQRRMQLAAVAAARAACAQRPSWTAIFTKAYARVAAAMPELRRAYIKFPWPRLYEYSASVASITFERDYGGENVVFCGRIKKPERMPLSELSDKIRDYQEGPLETCKDFQRALRLGSVPWPFRRWLWWLGLNIGRQRAKFFGTFMVSVYSALGAESLHPLSPLTTTLNYGVLAPDGSVDVRLVYDHRVMDGATIARALARLEVELNTSLCAEMRSAVAQRAA